MELAGLLLSLWALGDAQLRGEVEQMVRGYAARRSGFGETFAAVVRTVEDDSMHDGLPLRAGAAGPRSARRPAAPARAVTPRWTAWASQRVHRRLYVTVLFTLLGALALARPAPVSACSCAYVAPLDALAHADAVVAGRVVLVTEPPAWPRLGDRFPFLYFAPNPGEPIVVTLAVDTVWKGPPQAQLTVISQHPVTDQCATYFPPGGEFLIYAMRDGDNLRRAFCQRVVDLRLAADDLAQLGPGVAPAQPAQAPAARPAAWLLPSVLLLTLLVLLLWKGLRRRARR